MDRTLINVAFSSDNNFAQHLCVSIYSLLDSLSPERHIRIIVLDGGISTENREKIIKTVKTFDNKKNSIEFYSINKLDFSSFKESKQITKATYYRIKIPELFPDIKKILYLDCDLIIVKDISPLFDMNFGKNYLLAVKDSSIEMEQQYRKYVSFKNGYFNAGVLLINLEKFRNNNISSKIEHSLKNQELPPHSHDQGALNKILFDKWGMISPVWNQLAGVSIEKNFKNTTYLKKEFFESKNNPSIIHFSSRFSKPWSYESISPNKELYYKYLKKTLFKGYAPIFKVSSLLKLILNYIYFRILPSTMTRFIYKNFAK